MSDEPRDHWERVYQTTPPTGVSWYEPVPRVSLALILEAGLGPTAPILDVGGGSSTLVDHLLRVGFTDLTVLDVAPGAFAAAQSRLGDGAAQVHWITTDISDFRPARQYALWHDRAVFHFQVDRPRRDRYLEVLRRALAPEGHLVLATFGPEGPTHCSGLEVQRYSAAQLGGLLGTEFRLVRSQVEDHPTPRGGRQQFSYGLWKFEA